MTVTDSTEIFVLSQIYTARYQKVTVLNKAIGKNKNNVNYGNTMNVKIFWLIYIYPY